MEWKVHGEGSHRGLENITQWWRKSLSNDEKELAEKNMKSFCDLILSIDCTKPTGKVAIATIKNAKTKEI
jgi:hypothetical protein